MFQSMFLNLIQTLNRTIFGYRVIRVIIGEVWINSLIIYIFQNINI